MELLPVHRDEHIKGFTQEVAAAHTGVKYGEAGEIERCRGIECIRFDVVFPGSRQNAIRVDFMVASSQAVLKQPFDHVGFGEEFGSSGYL